MSTQDWFETVAIVAVGVGFVLHVLFGGHR